MSYRYALHKPDVQRKNRCLRTCPDVSCNFVSCAPNSSSRLFMVLLCRFLVCPKETKQVTFHSLCFPALYEEKTAHSFWKVLIFTQLKIQWFLRKGMTLPYFFIMFVNSVMNFLATERITDRNNNNSLCLLSDNESSIQWCKREKNYGKPYPSIQVFSKGDADLGREVPGRIMKKLFTTL